MKVLALAAGIASACVLTGSLEAAPARTLAPAACKTGSLAATIGGRHVCLRAGQRCKARYERQYRRKGFHCDSGRLRRLPRKPPAQQPAQPGHYKGTSSQLTNFEFDVTGDGSSVTRLVTGQINESCTPGASLSGGNLNFGSSLVPVASDGSFRIDVTITGTVDGQPSTDHIVITGRFSGATAAGTLLVTSLFTSQGTPYSCTSNPQSWTASRTG